MDRTGLATCTASVGSASPLRRYTLGVEARHAPKCRRKVTRRPKAHRPRHFGDRQRPSRQPATLSPPRVVGRYLAEEIDLCQIDDLVAAPAENRFEHEEAQAGHLLEGDRRRHGELLAVDEDLVES